MITLDDLRLAANDKVDAATFLRVINRVITRMENAISGSADLNLGEIVGTAGAHQVAVQFSDGTVVNCYLIDLGPKTPGLGATRVVVATDSNRSVVLGQLA